MGINVDEVRKRLLALLSDKFVDPITGLCPQQGKEEEQLSALLGLFHQEGLIEWNRVKLYTESNKPSGRMSNELIGLKSVVGCEYPLFAKPASQEETKWGARRADLLFVQEDADRVVLVENKIGSKLKTEQLAGYLDYLTQCEFSNRFLILLSGRDFFNEDWYSSELRQMLAKKQLNVSVKSYLIYWEEVFSAVRANHKT